MNARESRQRKSYAPGTARGAGQRRPTGPKYALGWEADARIRTGDPFITSEVLYQLSYVGGQIRSLASDCRG